MSMFSFPFHVFFLLSERQQNFLLQLPPQKKANPQDLLLTTFLSAFLLQPSCSHWSTQAITHLVLASSPGSARAGGNVLSSPQDVFFLEAELCKQSRR